MIILNNCYLLATAMFRYLHGNEGDGRTHVLNDFVAFLSILPN